jgi:hypothetical protein
VPPRRGSAGKRRPAAVSGVPFISILMLSLGNSRAGGLVDIT